MSNNILFVFEGKSTEYKITKSLEKHILTEGLFIKCAFDAEIYQFYRELKNDDFLDSFTLIKNRNAENQETLKDYNRDDFAEIYLFFDYDGHSTCADDAKLEELVSFFNEETNQGKLYISYPMVEAIRHIQDYDNFRNSIVKCKGANCPYINTCEEKEECKKEPHYKTKVAKESIPRLSNMNSYTEFVWKKIIETHLKKMNYIVSNLYEFPQKIVLQDIIFQKQLELFINKKCPKVAVLSAFPIFIHDYYGNEKTKDLIG